MKTKRIIDEHDLTITNEFVRDADGDVTHEEIVCETSTRLPVLKLDDLNYKVVPLREAVA